MRSKYLPTHLSTSVFEVDYNKLYEEGKRIILFDLDNTLISYYESVASPKLIALGNKLLDMGFQTFVLTNNHGYRIHHFMENFPASAFGSHMHKPGAKKIMKFLKAHEVTNLSMIIMIGDQLVTDILCANRLGVESILVKSISRESEHLYTVINRLREPFIVRNIAKKDPEIANKIMKIISKEKK